MVDFYKLNNRRVNYVKIFQKNRDSFFNFSRITFFRVIIYCAIFTLISSANRKSPSFIRLAKRLATVV